MLAILAQLFLCSLFVFQTVRASYPVPSGMILDITEPLDAFKEGLTSKEEFMVALSSGKRSNKSEYKLVYDFEKEGWNNTATEREEMLQVFQILNDSLDTALTIQLVTFWRDLSAKIDESAPMNSTVGCENKHFPNILLTIVVSPDTDSFKYKKESWIRMLKLPHIHHVLGVSSNQNMYLGLVYTDDYYLHEDLQATDVSFVLYEPDIDDPLDLEDSFHHFQTLVKTKRVFSGLEMVYCLYDGFENFSIRKIYVDLPGVCILFDISNATENHTNQHKKFSVIPRLSTNQYNPIKNYSWTSMLPLALEAATEGFNTFLMNHRQWKQLKYIGTSDLFRRYKPETATTPLKVIIDYSDERMSSFNISLFEKDWKNTTIFSDHREAMKVEALVFKLSSNKVYFSNLQTHLADFPSKPKIGCSVMMKNSLKNNNFTRIVTDCKSLGGTLYILKSLITLEWDKKPTPIEYDDYKILYMEDLLNPVKKLQEEILDLHPDARVYFQVGVIGVNQQYDDEFIVPVNKDIISQSLFCHPALLYVNQIFVAMITWANVHNFPVILNSALSHDTDVQEADGEWLLFLRKVPRINRDIQQKHKSADGILQYTFPIGHNEKYKTDSCIDWTEVKPVITNEYFNNNNIGTIFHTDNVQHSGAALEDVLNIMLQFVFRRFRLVEIVSSSNFSDVLPNIASLSNSTINSTVFINFSGNQTNLESSEFTEFLKQIEKSGITSIKGIHLNLSQYSGFTVEGQNPGRRTPNLQLPTLFKDKIVNKKFMGLKFGILVSIEFVFELIQYDAEFSEQSLKFFSQTDYIVFYQKIDFKTADFNKMSHQERMFNKHLNCKRIITNLFPHLEVYFRIDLNMEFKSDSKIMKEYLILLSHAKEFSRANDFGYFIVEAFDNEEHGEHGWWEVKSGEDPANPKSYVEKEAEFSGRPMWYPNPITPREDPSVVYQPRTSPLVVVSLSLAVLLLFISIIVGSVLFVRYRKLRQYLSDEERNEFLNGNVTNQNDADNTMCTAESMKFDANFDLQMSEFHYDCGNILGMGNFGTVYKGEAKGAPAAIKQPNKNCSKETFKSVLTEIKVLCYISKHSNVVEFIGAYTKEIQQGILFIVIELCSNGSLENLLRTKKSVISEQDVSLYQPFPMENLLYFSDLHRFAREIANGMEYIESKNIVHGDLSARNILLDENLTCKIGDFGLSRKLYEYQKYVKKSHEPLPWKWMAVESLAKMEFTSKSDVWSYGITVWEIYSLGDSPYAGLNWTVNFVDEIRNGLRLSIPQFATQNIYEIMLDCWHLDAEQRPTFTTLRNFFKQLCDAQHVVFGDP